MILSTWGLVLVCFGASCFASMVWGGLFVLAIARGWIAPTGPGRHRHQKGTTWTGTSSPSS